jgi:hypothetical protein
VLVEDVCLLCIAMYPEVASSPRTTEHSAPDATLARLSEATLQLQAADNARQLGADGRTVHIDCSQVAGRCRYA